MFINANSIVKKNIYYAFFDVDETIIQEKSMFSFLNYYTKRMALKLNLFTVIKYLFFLSLIKYLKFNKTSRDNINKIYYRFYKGIEINTLNNFGNEWFNEVRKKSKFFNDSTLNEIRSHKKSGAKVILVSGSFHACLKPIAKYLDIDEILCTEMEVVNKKCTGKLLNKPAIGEGKLILIKQLLIKNKFYDYSLCYAYGDHISDLSMLEFVGNPRVIPNCKKLLDHAKIKGWVLINNL